MIDELKKRNEGGVVKIGKYDPTKPQQYKIQFLNTKIYNNENDNSNVLYFNYHNYKFVEHQLYQDHFYQ